MNFIDMLISLEEQHQLVCVHSGALIEISKNFLGQNSKLSGRLIEKEKSETSPAGLTQLPILAPYQNYQDHEKDQFTYSAAP